VTFNLSTRTGPTSAVTGLASVIGSGLDTITGTAVTWNPTGANSGTGNGDQLVVVRNPGI
jgi:hypothetical protein